MPKVPKITSLQYLAISQGKCEGWSWFFVCRLISKVSSNLYYYFRYVWPGMPKSPKITRLVFLSNILRNSWFDEVDFLHVVKHGSFLQTDTMIFDGDSQVLPKFPK